MTENKPTTALPDKRLSRRIEKLVKEHCHAAAANKTGPARLREPSDKAKTVAADTQAQWRLLKNDRVLFDALLELLLQLGAPQVKGEFVLVPIDWSMLNFGGHNAKEDRLTRTHETDVGYELTTSLLIDAKNGLPLFPSAMYLKTSKKYLAAGAKKIRKNTAHLDQVEPLLEATHQLNLPATPVLIIDREGDAALYFRKWDAAGEKFLIRARDHRLTWNGVSLLPSEIYRQLRKQNRFRPTQEIKVKGRRAFLYVAETEVILTRPGMKKIGGKNRLIPGEPLTLRLVVAEARDLKTGKVLSTWYLLSNLPKRVSAARIARWYYWRWTIERMFKLLKSEGHQLETWLQRKASALFRRLLIAFTACVKVWALRMRAERGDADAISATESLFRLSGRTRKTGTLPSASSLLAGLYVLFRLPSAAEELAAFGLSQHVISQINTAITNFINTL